MGEPDITLVLGMREAYTLRQGSCELYTFGWGFGAANPPQTPTIGEVRRGPGTLWVPPPHLPNCKADRCQAKPCLSLLNSENQSAGALDLPMLRAPPQSRKCQVAHGAKLLGQAVVQLQEQLLMQQQLPHPCVAVDRHQFLESRRTEVLHPTPVEVLIARHPADWAFDTDGATAGPLDDPFQHAHILAIPRPQEVAVLVLAEPVDAEDPGRVWDAAPKLDPVVEVVGHVVAAEWQHRERVAPHLPDLSDPRCGCLGAPRPAPIDAIRPVELRGG